MASACSGGTACRLLVPTNGFRPAAGHSVTLAVRPERVQLAHAGQPAGDWELAGTVREAVYLGTDTRYVVGLASRSRPIVAKSLDRCLSLA